MYASYELEILAIIKSSKNSEYIYYVFFSELLLIMKYLR
jgi:hypothetical protein